MTPLFVELYKLMGKIKADLDNDKLSNVDILCIIGLLSAMKGTIQLRLKADRAPFWEEEKEK